MDSLSRQYYERSLGAGMFVSPETENGMVGYSEPLRRFIQHEGFTPQVNEIENRCRAGSLVKTTSSTSGRAIPYIKVDEGYARLPGAGYAALHPELEGVDPEDYPDITKLSILGDVAPYSREYNRIRAIVEKQSHGDPIFGPVTSRSSSRCGRPRSRRCRSISAGSMLRSTRSRER